MKNNWPDNLTIQQYLEGSLDKKLMHELERKALEDPFLADALEGYAQISRTDHGLSILQRQLHERIMHQQENKKVFDLSWQRLSIAAAAAVMFIAAGILFWMNSQVSEQKLAGNQSPVEVNVTPIDKLTQDEATVEGAAKKPEQVKIAEVKALNSAKYAPRPTVKSKAEFSYDNPARLNTGLISKSDTFFPNKNARVPANVIMAARSGKVDGIAMSDSLAASALNPVTRQALSEVAISRFAADSQQKAYRANGVEAYKKDIQENYFKATPAGGWEAYRTYLKESIARTASSLQQKGKVIIEFKVNQVGSLTDFKVLKGLSASADSMALQLIKSGPGWKTAPDVKVADLKIELDF